MAPSDGTTIYYYILYTCQTRNMASGQVSDNAEDFDPQRFFSMRIIQDDGHREEEDSGVGDRIGNPLHIPELEEPKVIHYLDDHIEVNYTGTILAPHSSNESVADESDGEIPELIYIPDDDEGGVTMESIPQMNGITYNLGPDLESDREEFMGQFHSIAPSNCPYCNNCHPHVVVDSLLISVVSPLPEID
jgi:hypothetical protein